MISLDKQNYIRSLADRSGFIEPTRVIQVARDPANILHDEFVWDELEAAKLQWLDRARSLIRMVRLEITIEHKEIRASGFVLDPERPAKSNRYMDIARVAQDPERARQVIIEEMSRITSAVRRAQAIAAVLDLEDDLNRLLENICAIVHAAGQAQARAQRAQARASRRAAKGRPRASATAAT